MINNPEQIKNSLQYPARKYEPAVIGNGSSVMKKMRSDAMKNQEMVQIGSNAGTYGMLAYSPDKRVYAATRKNQRDGKPVKRLPVTYRESRPAVIQTTTGLNGQAVIVSRNWSK